MEAIMGFTVAVGIAVAPFLIPGVFAIFSSGISRETRCGLFLAAPVPFIIAVIRMPEPVPYDISGSESMERCQWWFEALYGGMVAIFCFPAIGGAVHLYRKRGKQINN